jgi:hypothetical protein
MSGIELIMAERDRQIHIEGWLPEHDDRHNECELLDAAFCYGGMAGSQVMDDDGGEEAQFALLETWPFAVGQWKPDPDPVRNLVKAGALIAAEIDRLLRKKEFDAATESNFDRQ